METELLGIVLGAVLPIYPMLFVIYLGATNMPALMKVGLSFFGFSG